MNIDADLVNADWTKTSRDFPPGALEAWAAENGLTAEQIAELPSYYLPLERDGVTAAFDEAKHPRDPKGTSTGGRFTSKGGRGGTSPAEVSKADASAPTVFGTIGQAREWFQSNGVDDVVFDGIAATPENLESLGEIADAWRHEREIFPDIAGEYGLKAITTSADPRLSGFPFDSSEIWSATGDGRDLFEQEGLWASTVAYDPVAQQNFVQDADGGFTIAPQSAPARSMVVLNAEMFPDTANQTAQMRAAGYAVGSPEQAFAHELGHVHANALGQEPVDAAYYTAAGDTEEAIRHDIGDPFFRSTLVQDGAMSEQLAMMMTIGISPYATSSVGEAYAEHFVRRTYPESFARIPDLPDLRRYTELLAENFNRRFQAAHPEFGERDQI